ncbi:MAG: hypothetical protein JST40_07520 [Armatimonadetes bacterium]|nr:hypothetical protein [Armatimonadota bacterium]
MQLFGKTFGAGVIAGGLLVTAFLGPSAPADGSAATTPTAQAPFGMAGFNAYAKTMGGKPFMVTYTRNDSVEITREVFEKHMETVQLMRKQKRALVGGTFEDTGEQMVILWGRSEDDLQRELNNDPAIGTGAYKIAVRPLTIKLDGTQCEAAGTTTKPEKTGPPPNAPMEIPGKEKP